MNKHWANIILTDHARERAIQRSITQQAIEQTLKDPDFTWPGKKPDTIAFAKIFNQRKIRVVASYLSDQKKWLVISVWVKGEDDKTPFVWRVIQFPFWMIWKLAEYIYKKIIKGP